MAGRSNWGKLDAVVKKIEAARAAGLRRGGHPARPLAR